MWGDRLKQGFRVWGVGVRAGEMRISDFAADQLQT